MPRRPGIEDIARYILSQSRRPPAQCRTLCAGDPFCACFTCASICTACPNKKSGATRSLTVHTLLSLRWLRFLVSNYIVDPLRARLMVALFNGTSTLNLLCNDWHRCIESEGRRGSVSMDPLLFRQAKDCPMKASLIRFGTTWSN